MDSITLSPAAVVKDALEALRNGELQICAPNKRLSDDSLTGNDGVECHYEVTDVDRDGIHATTYVCALGAHLRKVLPRDEFNDLTACNGSISYVVDVSKGRLKYEDGMSAAIKILQRAHDHACKRPLKRQRIAYFKAEVKRLAREYGFEDEIRGVA